MPQRHWDAVGVGIGPANLSLAALLDPLTDFRPRFFDRRPAFEWHPGLLLDGTTIQVSFIKDLVTLADPTSRFSFLAFLHAEDRIYSFFHAEFPRVSRTEFNQYYRWASERLRSLEFGTTVEAVTCDRLLRVHTDRGTVSTTSLVLGSGAQPLLPDCAAPHLGPTVFHACSYLQNRGAGAGRRVVVVGGGQTGAEIVLDLLADPRVRPREVCWLSRRPNFLPLDESPFANEWFTPAYSDHFFQLAPTLRERLVAEQKLASDGISPGLLGALYRRLYELRHLDGGECRWRCCPGRELRELAPAAAAAGREAVWRLRVEPTQGAVAETLEAEVVILATGFSHGIGDYLKPIAHLLPPESRNGDLHVRDDFSVAWDGPPGCRIFVQGGARVWRGPAERNLSLNAWRSATIVNSLLGRTVYRTTPPAPIVDWGTPTVATRGAVAPRPGRTGEAGDLPAAPPRLDEGGRAPEPDASAVRKAPR
jgi:lysine N6-hydroxylase